MQESLRRVSNQKAGSRLPPMSAEGRSPVQLPSPDVDSTVLGNSQQSHGSPNLSMSLGFGDLALSSHDQALLARARASHDSQLLSRLQSKKGSSTVVPRSRFNTDDAPREPEPTSVFGNTDYYSEGRTSEVGISRLFSGSQVMGSLQGVAVREGGRRLQPGDDGDRGSQELRSEPWSEDELDSLWRGSGLLLAQMSVSVVESQVTMKGEYCNIYLAFPTVFSSFYFYGVSFCLLFLMFVLFILC